MTHRIVLTVDTLDNLNETALVENLRDDVDNLKLVYKRNRRHLASCKTDQGGGMSLTIIVSTKKTKLEMTNRLKGIVPNVCESAWSMSSSDAADDAADDGDDIWPYVIIIVAVAVFILLIVIYCVVIRKQNKVGSTQDNYAMPRSQRANATKRPTNNAIPRGRRAAVGIRL